ncbi:MAG: ATP-dependent protease ATPase subunit HslU [Firmicutes bacterium]|nr:ATP-dependent protease ATPase subunit HslU [Bacillota bacterium]
MERKTMDLTPKQIVEKLDKHIIGQHDAKRAVAVALRNRYRRSLLDEEMRDEVTPKNIIMKGPTGVGKTEIARRLAKIVKAPFIKVEATKFTEVGYVGRDVESMIRDLAETAIRLVKEEKYAEVQEKAQAEAERKISKILFDIQKADPNKDIVDERTLRDTILEDLKKGKYNETTIEIEVVEAPKTMEIMPGMGAAINIGEMLGGMGMRQPKKKRKMRVIDAIKAVVVEESEKFIDKESINAEAIHRAEQHGIIFIDEIDKIASSRSSFKGGPDVSREGVQRDILPIVEGSTVMTKYGAIKTDYILFIASGAFHITSVQDLIPELQGRFPVLVELQSLGKEEFTQILTNTQNSITKQYTALLEKDNVFITFSSDGIEKIAEIAFSENETKEDIGARRLHTLMERLLEDLSFNAGGDHPKQTVKIDKKFVEKELSKQVKNLNLRKYIL